MHPGHEIAIFSSFSEKIRRFFQCSACNCYFAQLFVSVRLSKKPKKKKKFVINFSVVQANEQTNKHTMALSNVLILSQIAGHVVVLILSLCIITPMIYHVQDFNGECILFSMGNWNENNGLFDVKWASIFYCNFTILTGFFLFFVSLIEIYR